MGGEWWQDSARYDYFHQYLPLQFVSGQHVMKYIMKRIAVHVMRNERNIHNSPARLSLFVILITAVTACGVAAQLDPLCPEEGHEHGEKRGSKGDSVTVSGGKFHHHHRTVSSQKALPPINKDTRAITGRRRRGKTNKW